MAAVRGSQNNATRRGIGPFSKGSQSYGEEGIPGSMYAASLQERSNLSNPRNQGPEAPETAVGSVGRTDNMSRKTGKVG